MGFWYFLILFISAGLLLAGIFSKKRAAMRTGLSVVGVLGIAFALFMFQPGSAEIMANLLNLNG
ncbi:hypothetical protein [Planomicrobium sp. YIM 101495]|uniref:hypothetical protein n=1 Tax=Planomicrobium sp. YIM 101495 TaxID=2665160 RepID=UPI0012BA1F79|nr:hypothetical protein [Planomicrobium sp. YIM 101495]MTD31759.1 hypothetical protein [Planomicrobium sp. YIM 101495]